MAGVVAAMFGLVWAVHAAGVLTLLSGLVAWALMNETLPGVSAATANALRPAPTAPGSTTLRPPDPVRRLQ